MRQIESNADAYDSTESESMEDSDQELVEYPVTGNTRHTVGQISRCQNEVKSITGSGTGMIEGQGSSANARAAQCGEHGDDLDDMDVTVQTLLDAQALLDFSGRNFCQVSYPATCC